MHNIFIETEKLLQSEGFDFEVKDFDRPWGGFIVIREDQTKKFIKKYFPDVTLDQLGKDLKVSPKILMVAPGKKLSWQYHFRRSELWRVVKGPVGISTSETDEEKPVQHYFDGDSITLKTGERHRLIGLDAWGIVAELWLHADLKHPSDEDDIVRLQDDFNRSSPGLKE